MSGPVPDAGFGADEDWISLLPHEIPATSGNAPTLSPTKDDYLDFQLRTRFGTFSFVARSKQNSRIADVKHDKTIHPQDQSPLFRLPTEVRLEIYDRLFLIPTASSAAKIARYPARDRTSNHLTVLLTCRRILAEAEDIFYSVNRLSLERPSEFLTSIGPRRRTAITRLELPVANASSMLLGLQQLRTLPNLTSLHVQRRISAKYQDVSGWAVMAPQLIAEIRKMENLKEVKILTPEAASLTEHEVVRKSKLDAIDKRISNAVADAALHTGIAR